MNIYKLLKLAGNGNVPRPLKLLGLYLVQLTGRRHIGVFFDPVMACNLRCRMCYFSDDTKRAGFRGIVKMETLDLVERTFFRYALKLQIGCGAEPSLYKNLGDILMRAKRSGVPYVSLVTNGQLLATGQVDLAALVAGGLDELTLSMHGTRRESYEYLMPGAEFENLEKLLRLIGDIKREYPGFRVRINFTVNSMNLHDLKDDRFWTIWPEGVRPDIVQLRPVQKMGGTAWTDYDCTSLKEEYDATIGNVIEYCKVNGMTCIAPTPHQIDEVDTPQDGMSALIEDITYCYVSPDFAYKEDFELGSDTLKSYNRRHHTGRRLLAALWRRESGRDRNASKKLNYNIK